MKIIEAMKKIKDDQRKLSDLRDKITKYAADMDHGDPTYPDQKKKVRGWLQAHEDISQEIGKLRAQLQLTNVTTEVTIEVGGNQVTKTIAEWISRRRDMAKQDADAWYALDKLERTKTVHDARLQKPDGSVVDVKVRRFYDPEERDNRLDMYQSEPSLIDARLEVVNAVTDLAAYN